MSESYIQSVKNTLHLIYGKDVPLYESTRKDKKFMVISPQGKKIHFGQAGYDDFHSHKDPIRRARFKSRNAKWANAPKWTPAHLSYYILW